MILFFLFYGINIPNLIDFDYLEMVIPNASDLFMKFRNPPWEIGFAVLAMLGRILYLTSRNHDVYK